jgi:DNA-binding MarR family transcriptional regulator
MAPASNISRHDISRRLAKDGTTIPVGSCGQASARAAVRAESAKLERSAQSGASRVTSSLTMSTDRPRPTPPEDLDDAAYRAIGDFRRALREFLTFSEQAAHENGLTSQQHQALLAIRSHEQGAMSIGELAECLMIRNHSAVELVGRLVARDLVAREESQEDRRRILLTLRPQGAAALQRISQLNIGEYRRTADFLAQVLRQLNRYAIQWRNHSVVRGPLMIVGLGAMAAAATLSLPAATDPHQLTLGELAGQLGESYAIWQERAAQPGYAPHCYPFAAAKAAGGTAGGLRCAMSKQYGALSVSPSLWLPGHLQVRELQYDFVGGRLARITLRASADAYDTLVARGAALYGAQPMIHRGTIRLGAHDLPSVEARWTSPASSMRITDPADRGVNLKVAIQAGPAAASAQASEALPEHQL